VLAVGTRLSGHASSETRRVAIAGHRDELGVETLDGLDQPEELVGLAAVREGQHDVLGLQNAEVPVNGLGRMEEERGCAGARERRRDLAADDPRLAHAGDDDAPAALAQHAHRAIETLVEAVDQREDGRRFRLQHVAREIEARLRILHGAGTVP
jgi:hypothetical protein